MMKLLSNNLETMIFLDIFVFELQKCRFPQFSVFSVFYWISVIFLFIFSVSRKTCHSSLHSKVEVTAVDKLASYIKKVWQIYLKCIYLFIYFICL